MRGLNRTTIGTCLLASWLAVGLIGAQSEAADGHSLGAWVSREHEFLRRYQAVIRQGAHDYQYDYQTPRLIIPIIVELFRNYVVAIHEIEEQVLYPPLRERMNAAQQKQLSLLLHDQQVESVTVQALQRNLEVYEQTQGSKAEIADSADYLASMINRHVVMQQQLIVPLLDQLTNPEQIRLMAQIEERERRALGSPGRRLAEQLLEYIEQQITLLVGRLW